MKCGGTVGETGGRSLADVGQVVLFVGDVHCGECWAVKGEVMGCWTGSRAAYFCCVKRGDFGISDFGLPIPDCQRRKAKGGVRRWTWVGEKRR